MLPCSHRATAVYLRVSTEDQAERQTIEMQAQFASSYCALHMLDYQEYRDDGVSGMLALSSRPSGKRLLDDARAGLLQTVLIYRIDRLGRTARHVLNAVHELEQYGVTVRSMTEPFDTATPAGRFLLTTLAAASQMERDALVERSGMGLTRAAKEGRWLGGITPYGYLVRDKYLLPNDTPLPPPNAGLTEADVVRLIFRLIADEGRSTAAVADYLNARGIPPVSASRGEHGEGKRAKRVATAWYAARVYWLVVNTTYRGEHRYGKRSKRPREAISRSVPALVSDDLWNRAQAALQRTERRSRWDAKREYLLRGILRCGACGRSYQGTAFPGSHRQRTPDGKRSLTRFYICRGKHRRSLLHNQAPCRAKNLNADEVEAMVWDECMRVVLNPDEALAEVERMATANGTNTMEKVLEEQRHVEQALLACDEQRERMLVLYRRGLISEGEVEKHCAEAEREKEALRERHVYLAREHDATANRLLAVGRAAVSLERLKEVIACADRMDIDARRAVIRKLVARAEVVSVDNGTKRGTAHVRLFMRVGDDEEETQGDTTHAHPCIVTPWVLEKRL